MEKLKSDGIPLHYQVKQQIRDLIDSNTWQHGMQIPTELDLCQSFGVSRTTIRQALQTLVNDGLLERHRGKGTFVCRPKLEQPLTNVYSLHRFLLSQGLTPETQVLELKHAIARSHTASSLRVEAGAPVWKLTRLRLANGGPIVIDTSWLPTSVWPQLDMKDLEGRSLYDILSTRHGRRVKRAQEVWEPVLLDDYEAEVLDSKPGTPAFLVERTAFDEADTPVEFTKTIVPGDRMRFSVNLEEDSLPPRKQD